MPLFLLQEGADAESGPGLQSTGRASDVPVLISIQGEQSTTKGDLGCLGTGGAETGWNFMVYNAKLYILGIKNIWQKTWDCDLRIEEEND